MSLARTLALVGAALAAFFLVSIFLPAAERDFPVGGRLSAPPLYARLRPRFDPRGISALASVVGAVVLARRLAVMPRIRPRVFVAGAVLFLLGFSAAVVIIDGRGVNYIAPLKRERPPDYQADVGLVRLFGVRGFVEQHPELLPSARSIHTQTHPPGTVVLLHGLERAFPGDFAPRALVLAALASLVVVPTWVIGRRIGGERAAMVAVALVAVSPSMVMHVFLSMDAVYAAMLSAALALMLIGFASDAHPGWAVGAGAAVGAVSFFTYAVSFVTVFGIVWALWSLPLRDAVRALALAAAGGLAALAALRLGIGFDLLSSYRGTYEAILDDRSMRPYWYWVFGNPVAWLTGGGLAMAALLLRETIARRPRVLLALLAPLVTFYLLPEALTRIIPGETERTLLFAYPVAAAVAGAGFVRWERTRGAEAARPLAWLIGISAAQTVVLEAIYTGYW